MNGYITSYTSIVDEFIGEFTRDSEAVKAVVVDAAERFRSDYYQIVDVEEDEFDKGTLDDFYKEVREAIIDALRMYDLL